MKIFGLDASVNGSGVTKLTLDDNFNIMDKTYICFTDKKYISEKSNGKIFHYKSQVFKNYIDKNNWFHDIILEFISDCSYGAIENYSFASKGLVFNIAEFTGNLKSKIYDKGISLRLLEPAVIKKFASAYGGQGKELVVDSYESLPKEDKFDLSYILEGTKVKKKDPKYESPYADIVDSFWITQLLLTELKVRNGITLLKDLDKKKIEVFNHVNKRSDTNILATDFLSKE